MALSIFEDKTLKPSEEDISKVLGDKKALWDEIKSYIAKEYGELNEEWKNYGKASGWTLLIKLRKRTILYLFPALEYFIVQFVYGEKAVEKSLSSLLPSNIVDRIKEAQSYVEGRSFRIDVRSEEDMSWIKELIDIKVIT